MQRSILNVENASIAYGKNTVVEDVSFQLDEGEIACFLGPSGCGKTTLLRAIAGFEALQRGVIKLKNKVISNKDIAGGHINLPPEQRNIGMVFQDFALFPHLDIGDNIAFGLRHLKRKAQKQRTRQLLEMVSLGGFESRYPHQLSGGQQQRIALARALAPKPDLLLMDEPFSSMDIELREELAKEVRQILKAENITAILVTHDQNEAFVVADNIGVMQYGKLLQWTNSYKLYHQPATPFVADFIGQGVFLDGEVINEKEIRTELSMLQGKVPQGCKPGCRVQVFIRPDDIIISQSSLLKAKVAARDFRGSDYLYTLQLAGGSQLLTLEHSHHQHEVGDEVGIALDLDHVVVFPFKK